MEETSTEIVTTLSLKKQSAPVLHDILHDFANRLIPSPGLAQRPEQGRYSSTTDIAGARPQPIRATVGGQIEKKLSRGRLLAHKHTSTRKTEREARIQLCWVPQRLRRQRHAWKQAFSVFLAPSRLPGNFLAAWGRIAALPPYLLFSSCPLGRACRDGACRCAIRSFACAFPHDKLRLGPNHGEPQRKRDRLPLRLAVGFRRPYEHAKPVPDPDSLANTDSIRQPDAVAHADAEPVAVGDGDAELVGDALLVDDTVSDVICFADSKPDAERDADVQPDPERHSQRDAEWVPVEHADPEPDPDEHAHGDPVTNADTECQPVKHADPEPDPVCFSDCQPVKHAELDAVADSERHTE